MELGLGLVLCAAAFVGGFIQGLAGFGSTLALLPLLSLALDIHTAVPVGCVWAVCLNAVLAGRLRVHIRTGKLALLLAASLPGMVLGAWGLGIVPERPLRALLALAVLIFVWREWRASPARLPAGTATGMAAGFLAGTLGALIGVNGPPVAAWVSRQGWPRDAVRGTQTAYFLLAGIGVVAAQAVGGFVTSRVLGLAILGLPALLAGALLGLAGGGRIDEALFRKMFLAVLSLSGVSLLLQLLVGQAPS